MDKLSKTAKQRTKSHFACSLIALLAVFSPVGALHPLTAHASGWYNTAGTWQNRKLINFNPAEVNTATGTTTPLSNLPVLVSVTDNNLRYTSYGGYVASSTGGDIMFTDSTGTNLLPYEIESYASSTGQLVAWVNVPSLSSTATTSIYIYFNNASATAELSSNITGTWSSNYVDVYHFANGSGLSLNDSTGNGNNATDHNGDSAASGEIGGGLGIASASNQYLTATDSASLRPASAITVSGWFNANSITGNNTIFSKPYATSTSWSAPYASYILEINALKQPYFGVTTSGILHNSTVGSTVSTSTWYYLVGTYNGTNVTVSLNGGASFSTSTFGTIDYNGGTASALSVGIRSSTATGEYFNGTLDELRIASVARSTDWIATEYNNQSSPGTFESFGPNTENITPNVSLVSPINGSTATSTITLTATSTDSLGVTGVQFQVDGTNIGSEVTATSGPNTYSASFDTTSVTNGTHVITAIAYNTSGNSASSSVSITTNNTPAAPSAPTSLTATPSASQSQSVALSWTAPTSIGSSPLTQYVIYFKPTASSTFGLYATTTASATNATTTGLTNNVSYSFEVFAQNNIGTSSASNIATATPLSFSPSYVAGLQAWYEGTQGLYKNTSETLQAAVLADPVAAWVDQSGNSRDAKQTTVSSDPQLLTRPALFFASSTGDYLAAPWSILTGNSARSIAVIFTLPATSTNQNIVSWGTTTVGGLSQIAVYNGGIGFTGDGVQLTTSANPYADGRYHVLQLTYDGSNMDLYMDGTLEASTTTTLTTGTSSLDIGRQIGGGYNFSGNIAEVLVYNQALSTSSVANLNSYLTTKYASVTPNPTPVDLTQPVPVILDTDIANDIDDVEAMAELNTLNNLGQASLKAVVTDSANNYSAPTVNAIDLFYGHSTSTIPIGAFKGASIAGPGGSSVSVYTQQVAAQFDPVSGDTRANYPSAVSVYRQVLASSSNDSVVIVSIGFLNNLRDLLQSPADGISPLTGQQLVAQKVRRLVMMGGQYPNSPIPEFNIAGDAVASAYVMAFWPTEIVADGFEIGNQFSTSVNTPYSSSTDPVVKAWSLFGVSSRSAWDPSDVLLALRGFSTNFSALGVSGTNVVNPVTGANSWTSDAGNVTYIGIATSTSVISSTIDSLIDAATSTTYTLAYTAGANGTLSGSSTQVVASGSNGSAVTAVPNSGYHFVNWSDASTSNPRTDTNIVGNVTVTANFALTVNLPTLTVQSASSLSSTTATLNATLTADGGASSTIEGFNFGTSTTYSFVASTTGTFGVGSFSQNISGLFCGTTYHMQAFAINSAGTGTSSDSTFGTNACVTPIALNTLSATGLSTSTATFNAQILSTGGANATQSGFAYGTSSILATVIATTTLGAQTGTTTFSQSFTNLNPNLTYYFRAYAVNSAGTTTGSILSFNTNDVTPPVVTLTAPANSQIVAGSAVQLSATAYDDVGVLGVQFKVGANTNIGSLITSTSSPNTYTTTWDSTGITTYGSHTLYAVAHDAAGNYSTSTVSVTVDNVAPTLLSAVYNSSNQITVTLSAAASTSTITKANNGGFTVTKTGSGTTYTVSSIAPGASTTQVILTTADMTTAGGAGVVVTYANGGNGTITDTLGNVLATNNTGITIPPWNTTAPIISSITSNVANGDYTIGAPIDIDLTFSKNVNSTGSVLVTLNTGGTCSFTVTNSNIASCTYTVASGQNTAALNVASTSGTIISTDSNAMTSFAPALNLANNKSIDIDTIAPSVTLRSPTASSTVLGHSITFSATAADVGTGVAGVQFILDGTNVGSMILSAPYSETWDSTAVADGTHTLSAVATDGAGNTATSTISFTTDNSTYTVGGTVSGLTGTVIVQNNATDSRSLSANGSFTFPTALADNSAYTVAVLTQPAGQTCSVTNSSGTVSGANVTSVTVSCANNAVASSPVVSFGGGGGGSASAASLATILAPSPAATAYINTLTTAPVPPPVSSITPVSAGAVGASVRSVQDLLVAQGLLNSADTTGFFGPLTKAAVIAFQIKHGIVASPTSPGAGIVGPKTTAAINATMVNAVTPISPAGTFTSSLSEGSTGSEVKALQEYLNTHGFVIAQTGSGSPGDESTYFGVLTEQALAKFQAVHDIPATGFFGPMTRNYVENH